MILDHNRLKLDWAKILYKSQVDDIRFAKEAQRKITYYTILIYGGIFFLLKNGKYSLPCNGLLLFIIYFVIFYFSYYYILSIQKDITKYRSYIDEIKNNYPIISEIINESREDIEVYTLFSYKIEYVLLYIVVILGGAIFFWVLSLAR